MQRAGAYTYGATGDASDPHGLARPVRERGIGEMCSWGTGAYACVHVTVAGTRPAPPRVRRLCPRAARRTGAAGCLLTRQAPSGNAP